jgi:hypothetical protein
MKIIEWKKVADNECAYVLTVDSSWTAEVWRMFDGTWKWFAAGMKMGYGLPTLEAAKAAAITATREELLDILEVLT